LHATIEHENLRTPVVAGVVSAGMATSAGLTFPAVWTAGGVVLGFVVTAFTFRIKREAELKAGNADYWLPPADFVLLLSMTVVLIGVFVIPVALGAGLSFATYALGFGFLLLAGYPFALAGHYGILGGRPSSKDGDGFKHPQELGVIYVLCVASAAYFVAVAVRELG
jgi:hypothetical protein